MALLGRSTLGDWLYVGVGPATQAGMATVYGWVSSAYIQTDLAITALPVVDNIPTTETTVSATPVHVPPVNATPAVNTTGIWFPMPTATAMTVVTPTAIPAPIVITPVVPTPTPTSTPSPTPSPTATASATGMTVAVNPTAVQANTAVHVIIIGAPPHVAMRAVLSQSNGAKAPVIQPS